MARHANQLHIVLILNETSIVRVHISSGESLQVVSSHHLERSESLELGDAVAQAMAAEMQEPDPKKVGNVWVLSDEVWSGKISLPKTVADAITPTEIQQTLALEAEHESGISAFDSRLSFVPLSLTGAKPTWWVTQAEQSQWDAAKSAIPSWASLTGLTSLSSSDDLDHDADINDSSTFDESFALRWLTDHLSDTVSIPAIVDIDDSDNPSEQKRFQLFVAAAVLLACFGLHAYGNFYTSRAADDLSKLVDQELELRKRTKRNDAAARLVSQAQQLAESKRESIERQRRESDQQQRLRSVQRQRPTQVLRALLATAGPNHWIQKIRMTPQEVFVAGLAVDSAAVTALSQAIENELGRTHWTVEPAEMNSETEYLIGFRLKLSPNEQSVGQLTLLSKGGGNVR